MNKVRESKVEKFHLFVLSVMDGNLKKGSL